MPLKEKLAEPMRVPINRILVPVAILLLKVPFRLLAQEPRPSITTAGFSRCAFRSEPEDTRIKQDS
jgi:hypothetical protein